jgi:flagellar hook-length control protein FliK
VEGAAPFSPVARSLQSSVLAEPRHRPVADQFDLTGLAPTIAHATPPVHVPPSVTHHPSASVPLTVITDVLNLAQSRPDAPTDLTLNPEELGRLRFEMTQSGDTIRVVLTVERADTLDLLRRNADHLMAEFKQAGFTGATLSFGQWGQGGADQSARQPQDIESKPADAGLNEVGFTQPKARRARTGLDLRL